jgi:hypothetical protein
MPGPRCSDRYCHRLLALAKLTLGSGRLPLPGRRSSHGDAVLRGVNTIQVRYEAAHDIPVWYSTRSFKFARSFPYTLQAVPASERSAVIVEPPFFILLAVYPGHSFRDLLCRCSRERAEAGSADPRRTSPFVNMTLVDGGIVQRYIRVSTLYTERAGSGRFSLGGHRTLAKCSEPFISWQ